MFLPTPSHTPPPHTPLMPSFIPYTPPSDFKSSIGKKYPRGRQPENDYVQTLVARSDFSPKHASLKNKFDHKPVHAKFAPKHSRWIYKMGLRMKTWLGLSMTWLVAVHLITLESPGPGRRV